MGSRGKLPHPDSTIVIVAPAEMWGRSGKGGMRQCAGYIDSVRLKIVHMNYVPTRQEVANSIPTNTS